MPLLRALLAPEQTKQFDVWVVGCGLWVTHRVSITALTGENSFMDKTIIVGDRSRALLGARFG